MPNLLFQVITLVADLVIFLFVGYYLIELRTKEKELEKKENKVDTSYHQIVDNALTKERKILDDATTEANQIITGATYVTTSSKQAIDQAIKQMMADIQKETAIATQELTQNYQTSLQHLATNSLNDFQNIAKELKEDLQKQVKEFRETLLPGMEKELEAYKQTRLAEAEQTVIRVVQKASQEILNKSISFDDHQRLMIEALEKAQKEGVFA